MTTPHQMKDTARDEAVAARADLVASWGEFLHRFDWGAFATLTFAQPRSPDSARRCFDRWVRRLEQRAQSKVEWFLAIESSPAGIAHVHSLCGTQGNLAPKDYGEAWAFGRASVTGYDRQKGARFYLVKALGTPRLLDYDVSRPLRELSEVPEHRSLS